MIKKSAFLISLLILILAGGLIYFHKQIPTVLSQVVSGTYAFPAGSRVVIGKDTVATNVELEVYTANPGNRDTPELRLTSPSNGGGMLTFYENNTLAWKIDSVQANGPLHFWSYNSNNPAIKYTLTADGKLKINSRDGSAPTHNLTIEQSDNNQNVGGIRLNSTNGRSSTIFTGSDARLYLFAEDKHLSYSSDAELRITHPASNQAGSLSFYEGGNFAWSLDAERAGGNLNMWAYNKSSPLFTFLHSGRFLINTNRVYGDLAVQQTDDTYTNGDGRGGGLVLLNPVGSRNYQAGGMFLDSNAQLIMYVRGEGASMKLHPDGYLTVSNVVYARDFIKTSDLSLKENISPITNSLAKVLALRGVYFNFKDDPAKDKQVGLIAQEVEKQVPEVVTEHSDGYKAVSYQNLVAVIIEAIKELYNKITGMEERLAKQEAEIKMLKEEIRLLKSRL